MGIRVVPLGERGSNPFFASRDPTVQTSPGSGCCDRVTLRVLLVPQAAIRFPVGGVEAPS